MTTKQKSWISLAGFLVVIVLNYLVASGLFPWLAPQKEVSQMYQTSITPAGYTFSIWGVIYLLLFATIVQMIRKASHPETSKLTDEITPFLWGMYFFNVLWNIVFCAQRIEASVLMILGYWVCLFWICDKVRKQSRGTALPAVAFGIHLGWLTIATIVNVYAMLVKLRWSWLGLSTDLWILLAVVIAVLATSMLQTKLRNTVLPLSLIWAFIGIGVRLEVFGHLLQPVPITLIAGILILTALTVLTYAKNEFKWSPER